MVAKYVLKQSCNHWSRYNGISISLQFCDLNFSIGSLLLIFQLEVYYVELQGFAMNMDAGGLHNAKKVQEYANTKKLNGPNPSVMGYFFKPLYFVCHSTFS
jgi:hypothetical protein